LWYQKGIAAMVYSRKELTEIDLRGANKKCLNWGMADLEGQMEWE
jgi:hypothetical protein